MAIEWLTFESEALRDNALGDPHVRKLAVYLPPDHDPNRQYPLVLMLSSHGNTGQSLTNWRPWDESIDQQMDRLIGSGCPRFIMAIPDTWTRLGGSPHINSPAIGNYGDYLLREIVPLVETTYYTNPTQRIIIGRSSGGYAALYHAMTAPGMFAACADHSGDSYFEMTYLAQIASLDANLARFGGLAGYMAETQKMGQKNQAFFDLAGGLTFAATFAPNPDAPFGFDLPVDEIGAIRRDVWERCLRGDPLHLLDQPGNAEALRSLRLLFIDCGMFDEYNLQVGARLLSRKLTALNVPHVHEEFPGGHRGTHFRYEVSLPKMLAAVLG